MGRASETHQERWRPWWVSKTRPHPTCCFSCFLSVCSVCSVVNSSSSVVRGSFLLQRQLCLLSLGADGGVVATCQDVHLSGEAIQLHLRTIAVQRDQGFEGVGESQRD